MNRPMALRLPICHLNRHRSLRADPLVVRHEQRRASVQQPPRITAHQAICHGKPTIRGLRYTVESVSELLAAGMTVEEVLVDYPDLERDDILAALEFGSRAASGRVVPLSAA
jgi:uncharacterized protein (DUF433 family)